MIVFASILILLAVAVVMAMFVRSRAKEGVGVLEVTDKDKEEFKEVRRELGIRRIFMRLIGGFAGISFIAGFATWFQNRADWRISVEMIAISIFLGFCTALLARGSK
jgi:uncharacterized membrane protein YfcA